MITIVKPEEKVVKIQFSAVPKGHLFFWKGDYYIKSWDQISGETHGVWLKHGISYSCSSFGNEAHAVLAKGTLTINE